MLPQNNRFNGNTEQYRGLGKRIATLPIDEALTVAGLDWKTVPMPLLVQGKSENRPLAGYKALVRSDNGTVLGVATDDYKPIHNHEILTAMHKAAGIGGIDLELAGGLDDGRRVWATGTIKNLSFSLPVPDSWQGRMTRAHGGTTSWIMEDTTVLKVVMGSGHVPGMAFSVDLMAERLICTNGAMITQTMGRFSMRHDGSWSKDDMFKLEVLFQHAGEHFQTFEQRARRYRSVELPQEIGQAFVLQLMQPELVLDLVKREKLPAAIVPANDEQATVGNVFNKISTVRFLEAITGKYRETVDQATMNRPTKRIIDLTPTQPGAEMAPNTLWNQYNAITYFVDHERGRNADSGLNAALFGEGRRIKDEAAKLADQYAVVMGR
jgi:hypothetical protein